MSNHQIYILNSDFPVQPHKFPKGYPKLLSFTLLNSENTMKTNCILVFVGEIEFEFIQNSLQLRFIDVKLMQTQIY